VYPVALLIHNLQVLSFISHLIDGGEIDSKLQDIPVLRFVVQNHLYVICVLLQVVVFDLFQALFKHSETGQNEQLCSRSEHCKMPSCEANPYRKKPHRAASR
jgi:hypothetical protein